MKREYRKAITLAVSMAMLLPISTVNLTQSNDKLLVANASDVSEAEAVANTLMDNYSVWNNLLTQNADYQGVTFLDVDLDGELEFVVANQMGTIRDTYMEVYKVDTSTNSVTKLNNASADYILEGEYASYVVDILSYDVNLYTTTENLGELYSAGETFYVGTDCVYGDVTDYDEVVVKFKDYGEGVFQSPVFNNRTENGTTTLNQCVFDGNDGDTWIEVLSDNLTSYYAGLKDLNLTYEIVGRQGDITVDDLIQAYNAFGYDGFNGGSSTDDTNTITGTCGENAT